MTQSATPDSFSCTNCSLMNSFAFISVTKELNGREVFAFRNRYSFRDSILVLALEFAQYITIGCR